MIKACFIDANVFLYAFSPNAKHHEKSKNLLKNLYNKGVFMFTSHHVIEEVLHVVYKSYKSQGDSSKEIHTLVSKFAEMTFLRLIDPPQHVEFLQDIARSIHDYNLGVNDAYLLQMIKYHHIHTAATFDKKLHRALKKENIRILPR